MPGYNISLFFRRRDIICGGAVAGGLATSCLEKRAVIRLSSITVITNIRQEVKYQLLAQLVFFLKEEKDKYGQKLSFK